ncbi:hypothetical protein TaPaz_125 [Acinetobacter phage TaPaz]|nr:hypothetical protein TaPaz_125 [Acinetobacter phage TaPaz]
MVLKVELMSIKGFKLYYVREVVDVDDVTYKLQYEINGKIGSEYYKQLNCDIYVPIEKAVSNLVFNATVDGWLTVDIMNQGNCHD